MGPFRSLCSFLRETLENGSFNESARDWFRLHYSKQYLDGVDRLNRLTSVAEYLQPVLEDPMVTNFFRPSVETSHTCGIVTKTFGTSLFVSQCLEESLLRPLDTLQRLVDYAVLRTDIIYNTKCGEMKTDCTVTKRCVDVPLKLIVDIKSDPSFHIKKIDFNRNGRSVQAYGRTYRLISLIQYKPGGGGHFRTFIQKDALTTNFYKYDDMNKDLIIGPKPTYEEESWQPYSFIFA